MEKKTQKFCCTEKSQCGYERLQKRSNEFSSHSIVKNLFDNFCCPAGL